MRTVALKIDSNGEISLVSGDVFARAGEDNATLLTVDVLDWAETLDADVTYSIIFKRSDESAYPALSDATPTDGVLSVSLDDVATAASGALEVQLWAEKTDFLEKSDRYKLYITATLDSESTPTGFDAWIQALQDAASVARQATMLEMIGYGVVSGLIVSAQGPPDMTVSVSLGVAYMSDGTRFAPSAVASQAVTAADATNPRIDIVYLSAAGVITYLAGTAAATPSAPAVPTGGLLLAEIAVAANATTITTDTVTDLRKSIYSGEWELCTLQSSATGKARCRRIAGMLIELVFTLTVANGSGGIAQALLPSAYTNKQLVAFRARNTTGAAIIDMTVEGASLVLRTSITAGRVITGSVVYPNI